METPTAIVLGVLLAILLLTRCDDGSDRSLQRAKEENRNHTDSDSLTGMPVQN